MSPYLYPTVVQDRIERALETAESRRLIHQAKLGSVPSGFRSLRDAVGQGLIAIGERLVDHPEESSNDLRRAA
jgi:hypothetical protein